MNRKVPAESNRRFEGLPGTLVRSAEVRDSATREHSAHLSGICQEKKAFAEFFYCGSR